MSSREAPPPFLAGVRVVECASDVAGAFCGHALAELGVEVMAVHPPGPAPAASPATTLGALKRRVSLDLARAAGRSGLERLAHGAAVLIEERGPLGWPAGEPLAPRLAALCPGLLAVCLSPFGLTGPYAHYAAYPLTVYHAGGHAQQIPRDPLWPEYRRRAPVQAGGAWGESQAGLLAAVAALACLVGPGGPHAGIIDCSKQDALVNMNWTEVVRYPNEGRTVTRLEPWVTFVGGVLPAADGFIQIVMMEEHQWRAAMEVLGQPDWSREARFATQADRLVHWEEAARCLARETAKHPRWDLYRRGQALGLPVAPILSLKDVLGDPALAARGAWREAELSSGASVRMPRWMTSGRGLPLPGAEDAAGAEAGGAMP